MSVMLINSFEVPEGKKREALALWDMAAEFFRQQPGFISTRLHQVIVPWARFSLINVAEWESVQRYEAALNRGEYRKLAERFRDVARYSPGLYEVVKT